MLPQKVEEDFGLALAVPRSAEGVSLCGTKNGRFVGAAEGSVLFMASFRMAGSGGTKWGFSVPLWRDLIRGVPRSLS